MRKILTALISIAIFISPITAMSQTNNSSASNKALAVSLAPIKKDSDVKAFMMMTPLKKSPLRHLSRTDRKIFLDSLSFNEKGITSFNYGILKHASLSKAQAIEILSLVGYQHLIESKPSTAYRAYDPYWDWDNVDGEDHKGYMCEKAATCVESKSRICTSNC